MVIKKSNKRIAITIDEKFEKDIQNHIQQYNYSNFSEFVKEAIREKLYGKTHSEEIINKFLEEVESEKEFKFSEEKDIYSKLKLIAKRF